MNRNEMYYYLKSIGMFKLIIWRETGYHVKFVPDNEKEYFSMRINLDWGYIREFDAIHLCTNEIVIETKYGFSKININYKSINKFEVILEEE